MNFEYITNCQTGNDFMAEESYDVEIKDPSTLEKSWLPKDLP
jgi:hypothetical protein